MTILARHAQLGGTLVFFVTDDPGIDRILRGPQRRHRGYDDSRPRRLRQVRGPADLSLNLPCQPRKDHPPSLGDFTYPTYELCRRFCWTACWQSGVVSHMNCLPFGLFGLEMGIAPVKPLGRERLILGRLSSGIRAISGTTTSISTQAGMKLVSSVPERIAIRSCTLRRGYCAASLHRHHGSTGRPNGSGPPTQVKGYG